MKKYILTLDEGTTSTRAIITDKSGKVLAVSQHEFKQIYPFPAFVEHDAEEILNNQYTCIIEAMKDIDITADDIAAVGITNQRETTVVWDKNTGKPIYNAIVWQCRRTAKYCEELINDGLEDYILKTTGLKIDAYFSATKIKWILENVKGAKEKAENGELLFGTIDTWLLWKLSGGKIHATDYTNAARTMLFDIHNLVFDKKLLNLFGIPESMLPSVFPSGHNFGDIIIENTPVRVCAIAGDQQSALFGQHCFNEGEMKNTYGTGCFLLMNTGNTAVNSKNGLVTTLAATLDGENPQYALEGSVFIGGAVLKWLRDELGLISSAAQTEKIAYSVNDTCGVYVVPAFAGLGAPYWDMNARGTVTGLTRGANKNHLIRACLESIAYQTDDLISAMQADLNKKCVSLKADGGAAKNNFLMQFQANLSDTSVCCPENTEATAMGAAYLAGIVAGIWKDRQNLPKDSNTKEFKPLITNEERNRLKDGWKKAINATKAGV